MSTLTIQKYNPRYWKELKAVFFMNVPKYFGKGEISDLKKFVETYADTYYVALENNICIGAGGYYITSMHQARLSWYFIHPKHQGRGIGKSLADFSLRQIENKNISEIEVWTSQYGEKFFKKLGFMLENKKLDYWAEGIHLYKMMKGL